MLINIIHTLLILFTSNFIIYHFSDDKSKLEEICKWIHAILMIALFISTLTHIWTK